MLVIDLDHHYVSGLFIFRAANASDFIVNLSIL